MRILKSHPLASLANGYVIDSPQPSNLSYLWNFGSLLAFCLIIQIVTGVTLAMHYNPSVLEAFNSVEHIMRDVNNGWLIRYLHSNTASAFFFLVYLHIGRGLYYGSYRAPRTLVWTIGTVIFILMMATAFLGYVLPYGQMSLWGIVMPQMHNIFIILIYFVFILISSDSCSKNTKIRGKHRVGPHNMDVLSIIFGSLLGDAHCEKRLNGTGSRISFYQEDSHVEYLLYLHKYLAEAGYCNTKTPLISKRLGLKGKLRKIVRFSTWTYNGFNWIHEIWYENGKKVLPNCIEQYLTPLALAIWIMDDGSKVGKGLKFSTNNFTKKECLILAGILEKKFNLKASVQSAGTIDQHVIYVWTDSIDKLRNIVLPYIVPGMKYKIY